MKFAKALFILIVVASGVLLAFVVRPVPIPNEKDCLVINGMVTEIFVDSHLDVKFKLKDANTIFYINRGIENGLIITDLKAQLLNQQVTIKYPDYWTPLDPNNSVRHISKLIFEDEVIFTEMK